MSPGQSVELLIEAAGDARLRAQWQQLADAGLPSQARHTGPTNAPHITLAVRHAIPAECDPDLAAVAAHLPLAVRVGGLLVFPRRDGSVVLARAVVANAALLALHERVHEVLTGTPGADERLAPGRWQPHVTLARGLPAEQLATAVAALGDPEELATAVTTLRRWDPRARRAWSPS